LPDAPADSSANYRFANGFADAKTDGFANVRTDQCANT
jgi:hypothetical protein